MVDPRDPDAHRLVLAHRHRGRHGARRAVAWIAGGIVVLLLLGAGIGVAAVALFLHDPTALVGCDLRDHAKTRFGHNSYLAAADGSWLGTVPAARNQEPVPLARMGGWLPRATVAIEDRRFWERRAAVDYEAIVRAAVSNAKAGRTVQGGSTIQQQLVRDRYLRDRRPVLSRKLEEACLAVQLGQRMPKRQILEAYLNGAFYGHHAYGAQAAARTYFSRPARRLTLRQAALIAGLPQAPSEFDPLRRRAATRARRDEVLAALRDAGEITPARYARATRHGLELLPGRRYRTVREAPFFEQARRELVRRYGRWRTRRGGLRVRTTLDPRLQALAEQALASWLTLPTDPAGALVAIDPATGAVRAMAIRTPDRRRPPRFNLATQSRRQAGSTFKVFTLTAALESGIPLSSVWRGPSSLRISKEECRTGDEPWEVHNYADEGQGTMTLLQATAHSVNTIFAQVALRAGLSHVVDVARRMGIESPLSPVCSITLGPEGVSPLEMTSAFATLAARGIHRRPELLERVTAAADGRELQRLSRDGRRALTPEVADRVTYALTGVVRRGTGAAAYFGRPAAGKTGTAESFKDAWFCGYVPQLAACAWMGYPGAEIPMANIAGFAQVVGGSVPARIWHDFMDPAVRPWPLRSLPMPRSSR